MKFENKESLNGAAEKLSKVLIGLWANSEFRDKCETQLENQTISAKDKLENYKKFCAEPWQIIVWCYLSLNTKGSSKQSKNWLENNNFSRLLNFIEDVIFLNRSFNESQRFIGLNLILREFAGGKYLTIKKDLVETGYFNLNDPLTKESFHEKISHPNLFSLNDYEKKSKKADSWNLFKLFIDNNFNKIEINKKYNSISIIDSKIDDLSILNGISKKYARNIKMDMRTPDSENYIAIDLRIKNILSKIGIDINIEKYYNEIEVLFQNNIIKDQLSDIIEPKYVSRPIYLKGITPWELDRLLYSFKDEIIGVIK